MQSRTSFLKRADAQNITKAALYVGNAILLNRRQDHSGRGRGAWAHPGVLSVTQLCLGTLGWETAAKFSADDEGKLFYEELARGITSGRFVALELAQSANA
jgi:hypothetical protein